MKPSLKIEIQEGLRAQIRALDSASRHRVGIAIDEIASAWGNPHSHAGAGIRKLIRGYFEGRSGLQFRLVFTPFPGVLYFVFMGSHDEIRRFLKSLR